MSVKEIPGQFINQTYIRLETVRKNGVAVPTTVWFFTEGATIYVRTSGSSGKAKRIRNSPLVRIAPCTQQGKLQGNWVNGTARFVSDDETNRVDKLLDVKYGLFKKFLNVLTGLRKVRFVMIAIDIV
ncbi:MAG TPA: PPOX class F420-dependent oxidoreductase [Anaerolineae bacterium]|jgi:hypothetical protein